MDTIKRKRGRPRKPAEAAPREPRKRGPKPLPASEHRDPFPVRLPGALVRAVDARIAATGSSRSEVVEMALNAWIAAGEK